MVSIGVSKRLTITLLLVILGYLCLCLSQEIDTLRPGEDLRVGEALVSSNGVFELGFFSPVGSSSSNSYLGIWFKNDPHKKAVWVANRNYPLVDSSGVLSISYDGNLKLADRRKNQVPMIVNTQMLAKSGNTSAKLLDSGNLVLEEGEKIVWQSFYYPTDTLLPGMRLGSFNLERGLLREQYLVSWQSLSVPSSGSFSLVLETQNWKQLTVWYRNGVSQHIGLWDGQRFKFLFKNSSDRYNFSYVSNLNETYLTFSSRGNNIISWFVMASSGELNEFTMTGKEISVVNHSVCKGTDATECFMMTRPKCQDGDKFFPIGGSMLNWTLVNESDRLGLSDCEIMCRSHCLCTAFASFRDDGVGCVWHHGNKNFPVDRMEDGNGTIYIRGGFSTISDQRKKKRYWLLPIVLVTSIMAPILIVLVGYSKLRNRKFIGQNRNQDSSRSLELFLVQSGANVAATDEVRTGSKLKFGRKKDHQLPSLSFSCIATATDNFSPANKLGEGGFGPVYKGMLLGHEIAVKRLSTRSGQGLEEFKTEVQLISRLQHRNLVRLLGCCTEREEKILIYEYMPNKSLDSFLFDAAKKVLLDWGKRVQVIEGIAQGLLYIHKYSRLRIIHRDLKTSNILLDGHMHPKISDFGMARIFGDDEARAKTTRVVGTYGYMSPEYAVHGLFSIKSDVFSFGVIMLEIISGKKCTTLFQSGHSLNLLGYAWDLWKDGRGMELMDPTLANTCSASELMLCIQVALLCVQESPKDRPDMSDVVYMLSNERMHLPAPKQPAFCTHLGCSNSPRGSQQHCSLNDVTVSVISAR